MDNPFVGGGYRYTNTKGDNIKVKNKHGYYLTAGVDFTISEENKLDLQLSYVSYSKDAQAAFVSIVKAF